VLHYESVKTEDLPAFDAAFISGTSPQVLPVSRIGKYTYDVNDPVLRQIMKDYNRY
jgi:branched-chain amino acid aminotransferase